jgi:hypothetical protein
LGEDAEEAQRYQRERRYAQTRYGRIAYIERGRGAQADMVAAFLDSLGVREVDIIANVEYLVAVLRRVTAVRKIPGARLFFPEELPQLIADEAMALWMDDQAGRGHRSSLF